MFLASRGDDDLADDEEPSPEELELVERVRGERAQRRRTRRSLIAVVVVSLLVIVAALVTTHGVPRGRRATTVADEASSASDGAGRAGADGTRVGQEPSATAPPPGAATGAESATTAQPPPGAKNEAAASAESRAAASPSSSVSTPQRSTPGTTRERGAVATPPRRGGTPGAESEAGSSANETTAPEAVLPPRAPTGRTTPQTRSIASAQRPGTSKPRTADVTAPAPHSVQIAQPEPSALPSGAQRAPSVRVDVKQTPGAMTGSNAPRTVDYTVRVSHQSGGPIADADVRLRGVTSDGVLVEAPLDPGSEPGVYRGTVPVTPRGPNNLTVRVVRPEGVVEVPVGGTVSK